MIGRPLVFILPSGGTVCSESRSHSPGKVTVHTGNISKRKKKEKIKQRLGGTSGLGKKEWGVACLIVS